MHHAEDGCHTPEDPPATAAPRDRERRWPFLLVVLALTTVFAISSVVAYLSLGIPPQVVLPDGATVYYNEACGDCAVYLSGELLPALVPALRPLRAAAALTVRPSTRRARPVPHDRAVI